MMSGHDHWDGLRRRWSALRPPQRPHPDAVAAIVSVAGGRGTPVLQLGVTPELAEAFDSVVAVDKSAAMIRHLWPGDTNSRRAVEGDWLELDGSLGRFDAVVGDGSLNAVAYPGEVAALLGRARDHLVAGGRLACRAYLRPERSWTWAELEREASAPAATSFHAFRWKLAMRIAGDEGATVAVSRIHAAFADRFPDRDRLAARSGWNRADIDTIDNYSGSDAVYCFPTASELRSLLPRGLVFLGFRPSGGYDLAECCPVFCCKRDEKA